MPRPRRHLTSLALLAALAAGAAPAHAQEDGVTVDPDSPSGKEYALPLDTARSEGAADKQYADEDAPLFGAGVTPDTTEAPKAKAPSRKPKGSGSSTRTSTTASVPAATTPDALAAVRSGDPRPLAEADGGSDATIALAAGGGAVLALAAGGGLLLRRRRTSSP